MFLNLSGGMAVRDSGNSGKELTHAPAK